MPGLTLAEASELTGLSIEEIEQRLPVYEEVGLGPRHKRVLPYMLEGVGDIPYLPAPETEQEHSIAKLLAYLRERPGETRTVRDLTGVSGLNRAATEVALATLRVLGHVEKVVAPKHSGNRILWRGVSR